MGIRGNQKRTGAGTLEVCAESGEIMRRPDGEMDVCEEDSVLCARKIENRVYGSCALAASFESHVVWRILSQRVG